MKTYTVVWTERNVIDIQATSSHDACEKIMNCEYEDYNVSTELDNYPEVVNEEVPVATQIFLKIKQ